MSWVILEKSKVHNTQYILSKYNSNVVINGATTSTINSINIIGYPSGIITYRVINFDTSLTVSIECSNDGTNFFNLKTNTHTQTTNTGVSEILKWNISAKYIRLKFVTGGNTTIGNIFANYLSDASVNSETSGGGSLDGDINLSGHILPDTDNVYDIGTSSKKIRDLFLSDDSLWIGDKHKLSIDGGTIKFKKRSTTTIPTTLTSHSDYSLSALKSHAGLSNSDPISDLTLSNIHNYAKTLSGNSNIKINQLYSSGNDGFENVVDAFDSTTNTNPFLKIGDNANSIDGDTNDTEFRLWFGVTNKTVTLIQGSSDDNATARISTDTSGSITGIKIATAGSNYSNGSVNLTQTGGSNGAANITTSGGNVSSITITNTGSGYTGQIPMAEIIFDKTNKDIIFKIDNTIVGNLSN